MTMLAAGAVPTVAAVHAGTGGSPVRRDYAAVGRRRLVPLASWAAPGLPIAGAAFLRAAALLAARVSM